MHILEINIVVNAYIWVLKITFSTKIRGLTRFTASDGTGNIVDFQLTAVPPLVLSRFWIFKWLVSQLKRPTNLKKKPRSLPVYIGNIYRIFPSSGCPIQKAPGVPSVKFEISGSNQGFFSLVFSRWWNNLKCGGVRRAFFAFVVRRLFLLIFWHGGIFSRWGKSFKIFGG